MLSLFQKNFKKEEKFQFNTFNSIQARKEKSATVRRRGRRGGRAVAAVSVGQMLERADPDVVARGLAAVGAAIAVVVAEAEGGAALEAEEPGAAHEEPARARRRSGTRRRGRTAYRRWRRRPPPRAKPRARTRHP